jgi:hypothetical protein
MAIKGKSKAKSRPKPVARAPRREPVEVKPPLFQRRWLQFTGVFILGILAMSVAVWIYHGVNENHDKQVAADTASKKRAAAQGWQSTVETTFQTVGTISQPGIPPAMFPEMAAALKSMKGGTTPDTAAATFDKAAKDATTAAKALTTYDVASKISGQGFTSEEATTFTDSSSQLVTALNLYGNAATAAGLAVNATGDQQTQLVAFADTMQTDASGHLQIAWSDFEDALTSGGIVETPTGSGLGAGTGLGG